MSAITMNPSLSTHRAQIVAEAVVSAYIHEIAPPMRRRKPASAPERRGCTESPKPAAGPAMRIRSLRREFAPRRRAAAQLAS